MGKDLVWYKRNVHYNVGVRMFPGDSGGKLLSGNDEYVSVDRENLREFKFGNQRAIKEGLIIESQEPSTEWETVNSLNDEEIKALVKGHLQLKSRLPSITSLPILYKLLDEAKLQDRAKRIISMIQARVDELEEDTDFATNVLKRDDEPDNQR